MDNQFPSRMVTDWFQVKKNSLHILSKSLPVLPPVKRITFIMPTEKKDDRSFHPRTARRCVDAVGHPSIRPFPSWPLPPRPPGLLTFPSAVEKQELAPAGGGLPPSAGFRGQPQLSTAPIVGVRRSCPGLWVGGGGGDGMGHGGVGKTLRAGRCPGRGRLGSSFPLAVGCVRAPLHLRDFFW
jgi:hypothetical protein